LYKLLLQSVHSGHNASDPGLITGEDSPLTSEAMNAAIVQNALTLYTVNCKFTPRGTCFILGSRNVAEPTDR
jgi:hypothetical protein